MNKLSKEELEFITKCLKENKLLPDSYRYTIPSETKKEYELTYGGKERHEENLVVKNNPELIPSAICVLRRKI
jgi:site-specific DNA-methyltransferase (adenine-specific)/adenine-specific DNA-methyltransferase